MIDPEPIYPRLPHLADLDADDVEFSYDYPSDTLMVYLHGSRPAFSDPVGEHLYLRIVPTTEEVVGFQIEHFLLCVVREHPMFLEIAELAGVPADELAEIRRTIPREVRQQAALDALFGQLAALSSSPEELAREKISWSPPVLTASTP